jgi:predicted nucleic acid-binding protein
LSDNDRYWDSSCFLGWFKGEPEKKVNCEGVIRAAERGEVKIITSALTLVEVLYLKGSPKIPADKATLVKDFFDRSYIITVNLDREIAVRAQEFVWKFGIHHKDAIHIATADYVKTKYLDTFDNELIAYSGKLGDPPLIISKPSLPFEPPLPGL